MTRGESTNELLRSHDGDSQRVTFIELFFDLVFVFAVTQLSHLLLSHLTLFGAAQTLLLLLAVWRAWIDMAWVTNWFDPDKSPVRLMVISAMLVSLIMSAALPQAYGQRGLVFAAAFVILQVGKPAFVVAMLDSRDAQLRRNFQRILIWIVASSVLWLAGGFAQGTARNALWLAAVTLDYIAPAAGFFTLGLGRSQTTDWTITGGHFAERCQLFLIIALGESILDSGATFSELSWTALRVGAFIAAFITTLALWWIYFYRSAEGGRQVISSSSDPGRLGRSAYTYFHLPMVAGIIVTAVAQELVISHPDASAEPAAVAAIVGGPMLFVAGHALFKWTLSGRIYTSRLVALAVLAATVPAGAASSRMVLAVLAALVLAGLASWEIQGGRRTTREDHESRVDPIPSLPAGQA